MTATFSSQALSDDLAALAIEELDRPGRVIPESGLIDPYGTRGQPARDALEVDAVGSGAHDTGALVGAAPDLNVAGRLRSPDAQLADRAV